MAEPALYGISHSNRRNDEFWGKNQFNSSFPVALACFMRDQGVRAVYIHLNNQLQIITSEIEITDVFNAEQIPNDQLYFAFEGVYTPYQRFAIDPIRGIDLVVKHVNGSFLRPLEVKLTVIPDNYTVGNLPEDQGSEIVIRPATTSYCALGIAERCQNNFQEIRDLFEPVCSRIESWGNSHEMNARMPTLVGLLNDFERRFYMLQQPLIMQPIWRTQGKSPLLAENCFDIFIWSDFAFTRLFLDNSNNGNERSLVSRQMRCTARLARFLYEVSRAGRVRMNEIYTQMTFGHQSDKEFSVNGGITNHYMRCERLVNPALNRNVVFQIILNEGERLLSPERRFDQSVYFTMTRG